MEVRVSCRLCELLCAFTLYCTFGNKTTKTALCPDLGGIYVKRLPFRVDGRGNYKRKFGVVNFVLVFSFFFFLLYTYIIVSSTNYDTRSLVKKKKLQYPPLSVILAAPVLSECISPSALVSSIDSSHYVYRMVVNWHLRHLGGKSIYAHVYSYF